GFVQFFLKHPPERLARAKGSPYRGICRFSPSPFSASLCPIVPPMLAKIYSAAVYGVDAYEVEIEVNAGAGDPKMVIVGLPDAAVKESKDRVRTAIANSAYKWSRKRTTINLAPADIKKEGPSFDLPIALGMIAVAEGLNTSA